MAAKGERMPRHLLRRTVIAFGAGVLALPLAASPAAAAPTHRAKLPGTRPSWATSARRMATTAKSQKVSFSVVLPLRHPGKAERLAREVNDPHSAQYQHYLSAAAFNRKFGPTKRSVRHVQKFLRSHDLTITGVADGRRWVSAKGSVGAVSKAFGTSIGTYQYKGKALRAPTAAATVPKSVKPYVQTVTGLDDSGRLRHPFHHKPAGPPKVPQNKLPKPSKCSNYWGQHSQTVPPAYGGRTQYPTYICGYQADQLQGGYDVKSAIAHGNDGAGVTVAIIDAYASPTIRTDTNKLAQISGQPAFGSDQYTQTVFRPFDMQKACGGEAGWNGEETLDVESVHAIAPGAAIHYLGARNCDQGIDEALNYAVQHHVADVVSNSYGNLGEDVPASEIATEHAIFVQAAIEGIGMYFSSGDSGDEVGNTGFAQPDYPASDPMVTAVGGTSLAVDSANGYKFETGWGTDVDPVTKNGKKYTEPLPGSFKYGAGGGVSTLFDQPAYQAGVVPDSLAQRYGDGAMRVVPDVAAVADPYTGFLVGETIDGKYTLATYGGTSLACPVFTGIQALASQRRAEPIGFANPLLYALAGNPAYHDVTTTRSPKAVTNPAGSELVTLGRDSSLRTSTGYDDVTGVGSPVGAQLLAAEAGSNPARQQAASAGKGRHP